jgi:hypothetical protein
MEGGECKDGGEIKRKDSNELFSQTTFNKCRLLAMIACGPNSRLASADDVTRRPAVDLQQCDSPYLQPIARQIVQHACRQCAGVGESYTITSFSIRCDCLFKKIEFEHDGA